MLTADGHFGEGCATMNGKRSMSSNTIAAERRRRIHDLALQYGSVSVSELARMLNVVENTIRRDLDVLEQQGILARSHGGAVLKEHGTTCPPYSQSRDEHLLEKSLIGTAAARYLPEAGTVFVNAGSTTHQLALRVPKESPVHFGTNSFAAATHLCVNAGATVHFLGGKVFADSLETDGSLSMDAVDRLYWDVSFLGVSGIDLNHGVTCRELAEATFESRIAEHSKKVIVLCDSSKFGCISWAKIGPVKIMDVLVTDSGISADLSKGLKAQGVDVVIADEKS